MPAVNEQEVWSAADAYLEDELVGEDADLAAARAASSEAGLPDIAVSPLQGKFLHLLARATGARRVLEVGTLGGYSTIWLARALPGDGRLVSLELEPRHAEVARSNLVRAELADRVEVRIGRAADSLSAMISAGEAPFDLVFIDADKPSNAAYLEFALQLSRPGTLIVVDNVVRKGALADRASLDPAVIGSREVIEALAADPRVDATALQTVGMKGHDGFAVALVLGV
ncbi:MAG: methyltransferase [Acidimicrobiaceae bacterium]|nr:methyltransferase [Acidimicrobiaceae bacterium]